MINVDRTGGAALKVASKARDENAQNEAAVKNASKPRATLMVPPMKIVTTPVAKTSKAVHQFRSPMKNAGNFSQRNNPVMRQLNT